MGREVRKVPADWQHPKNDEGRFIPLLGGSWAKEHADWLEAHRQWALGFREEWTPGGSAWVPKLERHTGTYTEYAGALPSPDDYMPDWPDEQRTHYMMYEDTTEGTPISPAFATPEELAQWLVDNNASAFANDTASYESWLRVAKGGFACSMVVTGGAAVNGVDALS